MELIGVPSLQDEEILSCNIAEAWTNLKIDFEGFDYKATPLPQTKAYFQWLKQHLADVCRPAMNHGPPMNHASEPGSVDRSWIRDQAPWSDSRPGRAMWTR